MGVTTSYLTILNKASKAPLYVVGGAHCIRVLTVSKLEDSYHFALISNLKSVTAIDQATPVNYKETH